LHRERLEFLKVRKITKAPKIFKIGQVRKAEDEEGGAGASPPRSRET